MCLGQIKTITTLIYCFFGFEHSLLFSTLLTHLGYLKGNGMKNGILYESEPLSFTLDKIPFRNEMCLYTCRIRLLSFKMFIVL